VKFKPHAEFQNLSLAKLFLQMKKQLICLLAMAVSFTIGAQVPQYANVSNLVSQNNINSHLSDFEGLGVKRRGTQALTNALTWLKGKYTGMGYATTQFQEHSYSYSGSTCKNLIVTKTGTLYPNTFVIICGHYDSITGTGTNDNGSGTAILLEVARLLRSIPTDYSIKFIHFSGEEDGLMGSQAYVSSVVNGTNPKMNIRLLLNIDEVGGVAGMTNDTVTCERDTSNPTTNNAASDTFTQQLIQYMQWYSPLQTQLSYAYSSDYMSFQSNNEIITGLFETNETPYKHTANDLLVNMDPVYVYNIAKGTTGAMLHFAVASVAYLQNPNPVEVQQPMAFMQNQQLTIYWGNLQNETVQIALYDSLGQLVSSYTSLPTELSSNFELPMLNTGLYVVDIQRNNQHFTKKIGYMGTR